LFSPLLSGKKRKARSLAKRASPSDYSPTRKKKKKEEGPITPGGEKKISHRLRKKGKTTTGDLKKKISQPSTRKNREKGTGKNCWGERTPGPSRHRQRDQGKEKGEKPSKYPGRGKTYPRKKRNKGPPKHRKEGKMAHRRYNKRAMLYGLKSPSIYSEKERLPTPGKTIRREIVDRKKDRSRAKEGGGPPSRRGSLRQKKETPRGIKKVTFSIAGKKEKTSEHAGYERKKGGASPRGERERNAPSSGLASSRKGNAKEPATTQERGYGIRPLRTQRFITRPGEKELNAWRKNEKEKRTSFLKKKGTRARRTKKIGITI